MIDFKKYFIFLKTKWIFDKPKKKEFLIYDGELKDILLQYIPKKKTEVFHIRKENINLFILIEDDGPGFPEDIIKALGEPYIKSRSKMYKTNAGLGLGTFLGKTLLERQSAVISFENNSSLNGAKVKIKWRINDLGIST